MDHFDVVVCGLGAVGTATTYQLARRGARVLGIDRGTPPHTLGSSHGDTRITRQAIGEGLAYVPLARRSHELWREIEAETGTRLLTTNGVLVLASPGVHARHHGKTHFLETTIEAARTFAIDHEVLGAAQVERRFPQFRLAGDERGYYEPGGGFVRPEAAISAQLDLAARHGATIHTEVELSGYRDSRRGLTVTTSRGPVGADRLVLAAGAWTGSLLGPTYAAMFAISRQVLRWFAIAGPVDEFSPERFPAFIWDAGPSSFYGLPATGSVAGAVKVGVESTLTVPSVAEVSRSVTAAETDAVFDAVVAPRIRGLERRCVRATTCLYTTTPDGDFVIDRHPEHDAVVVVSACSGHGFKHSAAIGEAVAAELTGATPVVDLSPFSLSRLAPCGRPA